jgi:hypothetical protein
LRERISKGRPQPLILHADNGNAMRAATLESRLEELGVLRSFSRPRVSNDNPFSESLFRTVKYRPDYPRRPFCSQEEACGWVMAFVDWYNHQHRHSGIRFVTPSQRHSGQAIAIARQRAAVYERARRQHPRRWSRSTRCWRQPEMVWINPPPPENDAMSATLAVARSSSSCLENCCSWALQNREAIGGLLVGPLSRRGASQGPVPTPMRNTAEPTSTPVGSCHP